jgi:hypothetical protein
MLLFLPLVVACNNVNDAGIARTFNDQGRVCVFPEGVDPGNAFLTPSGLVAFQSDKMATITVMAPTCLSSSCSKDAKAQCSVMVNGNLLQVTSTASFRQEGNVCTDDCGALVGRCTTPPLPAGTYTLQHGADRITITVPSTVPVPCTGKALL